MVNATKDNLANKSQKKSIKPGFLGGSGGGDAPSGLNTENPGLGREDASSLAEKNLNDAEKAASGGLYNRGDNLDGAREAENSGFYNAGANSQKATDDGKSQSKFTGKLKKRGPLFGIIFALALVGGFIGGSQLFEPFSLIAQFQEMFNSMQVSTNSRSSRWMKWQLGGWDDPNTKNPVGSKFNKDKFKITERQAAELKRQGIEYDADGNDGKGVLKYTNSMGEEIEVTGDNFRNTYDSDVDFFHKYNAGSMTWRGQFANWFGTNTTNFLRTNKITRNLFSDYDETNKNKSGIDFVREKIRNRAKSIVFGGTKVIAGEEKEGEIETVEYDDDGDGVVDRTEETQRPVTNDAGEVYTDMEGNDMHSINDTRVEESGKENISRSTDKGAVATKLNGIAGKFNNAANGICGIMGAIGTINLIVMANQALQILGITSSYFEGVHKTESGYGDNAPINELATTLNERTTEKYDTFDGEVSVEGSAMESAGITSVYSRTPAKANDPGVLNLNFIGNLALNNFGVGDASISVDAFKNCVAAKAIAGVASAAIDAVTIGACVIGLIAAIPTAGVTAAAGCSGLVANIVGTVLIGAAVGALFSSVMAAIIPMAASAMTKDYTQLSGDSLGNGLASGANIYLGGAGQSNGNTAMKYPEYVSFGIARGQMLADQAKEERIGRSPFDVTSKYTFMGSIMTQLMKFNTSKTVMSTIASGGSVMTSSLAGLTPSASAALAAGVVEELGGDYYSEEGAYNEICPNFASIGVVGDSYCNKYSGSDMNTMDKTPDEVIDKVYRLDGVEDGSDGNIKVKEGSDFAKYIRYCNQRTSPIGVMDQTIVDDLATAGTVSTGNTGVDGAFNGAISSVPVLGDVLGIVQDQQAMDNIGYVTGESCVAGNDVGVPEDGESAARSDEKAKAMNIPETGDEEDKCEGSLLSPCWNKARYYQRLIEDQSLAETLGIIDKSAIAVYLEDYYEKNPLDDSYEGMLARYSGLRKETVEDTLDLIAYYQYINEYDASERYAFEGVSGNGESEKVLLDDEVMMDGMTIALEGVVYADVRNRNFAV